MAASYIYLFLLLLVLGVPIVFLLIFAPAVGFLIDGKYHFLTILPQRVFSGINQFPILAVPMFMLAGELMNSGRITASLVGLSNALLGHVRGGLAHVNILSSILFAGLSGSAVADTSALGAIFFPAMKEQGYTIRFAAAVTAASSVIGPIIPPSIIMILYAYVMEQPVAALFAGGLIPGIFLGAALMVTTWFLAKRKNFPKNPKRASVIEMAGAFKSAILPLLTPVIIIGGILSGMFTPTEAAAVAVLYALVITFLFTKTLNAKNLPSIMLKASLSAASVLLVVGASVAFGWIATIGRIPHEIGLWVASMDSAPWVVFFVVNIFLLIIGMFLDATPSILILGPILAPTMAEIGVHPIHFAVVMCVIVTVGLTTPPMGVVLFLASSMTNTKVEVLAKELIPFVVTHLVVIFIITYIPEIVLFLPRLLGLI